MGRLLTLHDPASARRHYAAGVWRTDTLYALLCRHADARPDAWALRDARRRLSWGALRRWVDAVAACLEEAGLRPGQRVALWLPSRAEAVVAFLAAARNGLVAVPSLHQNYTVAEVVALAERVAAAAFVGQDGYGADGGRHDVFAHMRALPSMRRILRLTASGDASFPDAAGALAPLGAADEDPDKVVYLAFTSGTTGAPKGVMHSDNTLLANGRAMVADWGHDRGTVLLSLSPMSHHIGTVALEQALVAGCELVVHDAAAGTKALDWMIATGATYVMGVPTHAIDVLAEARRRGLERLGAVRVFYMAGSPIPRETAERFLAYGVTPQNVYGMTENGSHQYTLPSDAVETIVGTCGRACAAYEIALWDPENPDHRAAPGTVGEIAGRGGCLMLGYFGNQAATEESFNREGWFLSGDLGRIDERGCLVFVGRKKDLIIRGGHNIHPARIEDLAMRHPRILRAAAVPIPDERLGERVCLLVITDDGGPIDGGEVLRHLDAAGLSRYDMPEHFLAMEAFPLTASGKVLKRELAAWAREGRIAPVAVRWTGA
ncbi:MAG: acyl--CoA ligase [Alphaproteobacteria bacterium]|nr:acyl--CoA ligase [Alphaproteobacteria bacterium]